MARIFLALLALLLSCSKKSSNFDSPIVKIISRPSFVSSHISPPLEMDLSKPLKPADLIDIALQNNPDTKQSWYKAKIAAARVGLAKSELYPKLDAKADGVYTRTFEYLGGSPIIDNRAYAGAALSYLLLDFGERSAAIEEAKEGLKIASWDRDAAFQEIVIEVLGRYYDCLLTQEFLKAEKIAEKEANDRWSAATRFWQAGLKAHSDVLTAKSDWIQTKLRLNTKQKNALIAKASLAKTMGMAADLPFEIESIPESIDRKVISQTLEELIQRAKQKRVDLLALHSQMAQKNLEIKRVKAGYYPKIDAFAKGGWGYDQKSSPHGTYNYALGISLSAPLFTGFKNTYESKKAYAEAQTTLFDIEAKENAIAFDVFKNFETLKSADETLSLSKEYLICAGAAYESGLEHYEAGIIHIFSLIDLSKTLSEAREAALQANIQWFAAMAQLAYATGTLLEDI